MSEKSIRKNYFFNVTYQILLIIVPLITAPYLSRVLGPYGIGRVSFAESIVSYFTMFAVLGVDRYGQREISYVQSDIYKRSVVFWETKVFELCTSIIVFTVFIFFALRQNNVLLYIVLSLNIMEKFVDVTWFFQGIEEFGKVVIRNILIKILQVICIFVFVKTRDDVIIYALVLAGFTFISGISLWACVPKYITGVSLSDIHIGKRLPVILSLFIPTVAIQVYTVLDKTMIGLISNDAAENGFYEQAIKLSKMTLSIVTALGVVMVPRIGNLFNSGKNDEVRKYMYRGYRFVWFAGIPLCFGIICCAPNFVPWFFGDGYEKVIYLLRVLSFLILAIGINNVTGIQYLIPTKRQNIFTITVLIGAGVNFVLNMLLIPSWQSLGAAIASVVAETVIAIVQIIIVRKEISPRNIILEGINYYISGLIMSLVLFGIGHRLNPTILNSIILVFVGGVTYVAMLIFCKDSFAVENLSQVVSFMKDIKEDNLK